MKELLFAIFGSVLLTAVRSADNIRLVGGATEKEGRVEIQVDGVWGTICDDHWDLRDVLVVCRELGFDTSRDPIVRKNAYFGEGSGAIHITTLNCIGTESSFGQCGTKESEPCKHCEDAGVTCMPDEPAIKTRLVYGNPNYGQLEIYRDGKWNGVCASTGDDAFTQEDASVVCKELGLSGLAAVSTSDVFPILRSTGLDTDFWQQADVLRQVTLSAGCQGDEDTLGECNPTVSEQPGKCEERIVITCGEVKKEDTVKLVGGDTQDKGNVLVLRQGIWLPLVDVLFNDDMVEIICRQLSNSVTETPYGYSTGYFGKSESLQFWATDTDLCDDNDPEIQNCIWGDTNRYSYYRHGAGVDCNPSGNTQYRLVGGKDTSAGILEVLHDEEWGTICNNSMLPVKKGVCSSLGLGYKDDDIRFVESAEFDDPGSRVWLSDLFCFYDDLPLRSCTHKGWGVGGCNKNENSPIAVSCSPLLEDDLNSKCARALSEDYKQVGTCTNEANGLTACTLRCRGRSSFSTALQGRRFACGKDVDYEWVKYDNGVADRAFKLPECSRVRKRKRSKKPQN